MVSRGRKFLTPATALTDFKGTVIMGTKPIMEDHKLYDSTPQNVQNGQVSRDRQQTMVAWAYIDVVVTLWGTRESKAHVVPFLC